jgi:membrane protease YdiL (CAAX protease family)
VLCIVRWKTGSLYPCMALHSLNNSVALAANEHLGWGTGGIVALTFGSLALIAVVTWPLSRRVTDA